MTQKLNFGIFGGKRVEHVRQSEMAECGLACLAMIVSYHGLHINLASLRREFPPSVRGVTLAMLMETAGEMGLASRGVRIDLPELHLLSLPAILHWDLAHYVVLEKVSLRRALVHDPNGSSGWVPISDLERHFTGVALELAPTTGFVAGDHRRQLPLKTLWTHIRGGRQAILQTIMLSLVIQAYALVSPYYLQLAVDSALPELNVGFLGVLALGFGLFAILNGVATLLRSSVLLAAGSTFGFGLSTNVARKLFRLPIEWFARRHVGDVLNRFQSVVPIRKLLAEDAPAALVDGGLAVLTLAMMLVYSPLLTLVTSITLLAYIGARIGAYGSQRREQERVLVAGGREQSSLIESVQGIRTIRLAGAESARLAVWQSRTVELLNGNIRVQRITNWLAAAQTTLFAIENIVVIWLAVGMIIRGGFSLGMAFAYIAYKTQFMQAILSLVQKASDFKLMGLHLERIADIALQDDDESFGSSRAGGVRLKGNIELRDVSYGYGGGEQEILRNVNLKIEAGESVAITGPSGGGKSTLLRILLGLTAPTSGAVIVDGQRLVTFGHKAYFGQVAAVLQEDTLFGGSLGENITLFDDQSDAERMVAAAKIAAIHDDVILMPMRYETLVGELGVALSGGQRQRVLLARALYRSPSVLVMDEATSHLDEKKEREVNEAIAALGITRIIVAHRRETIASADRVYVLDGGTIREAASY